MQDLGHGYKINTVPRFDGLYYNLMILPGFVVSLLIMIKKYGWERLK